ncbi:hypothetical protein [Pseudomonas sp. 22 E 5]|nr:hypothetical protein [Pseudomonas sp. 31 E 5]CRM73842.1 hypothetical protein [Pseudomonas sp. 31 E 6]CRM97279.1 hypothetical protein [Pseudomonas sp. 22 E 5]
MRLQALGPGFERAGLGWQLRRAAGDQLPVNALQVFKQNTPGDTVHHQVVDHQQQSLGAVGKRRQHRTGHAPTRQVQRALGLLTQVQQGFGICDLGLPQQRRGL